MKKCKYCGANVNDNDVFCRNCGKKIEEKPVPTSSEPPHDACVGSDNVEVQINETDETEEYNYSVEDETRSWRDKILYILGAIVIVGILGACLWNYYSSSQRAEKKIALADSLEKAHQDSIVHLRQIERAKQDSIYKAQQEEKEFLENFYKELDNHLGDEDEMILFRKHLTNRALSFLKDEYPYEDGCDECYATWMFTSEAGCDYDRFICRKIEQESENTFLVTNTWGYEHDSSFKTDYKVRLGIVKEGDSYKINTIENASEKEREELQREINQYSRYVGRWILRKRTDEGRKMLIEVKLKENHSGELAVFHERGNVDDVIAYEKYPHCILEDGVIYMTKNGTITKGSPQLRVASDGLYSFDGDKYIRQSE